MIDGKLGQHDSLGVLLPRAHRPLRPGGRLTRFFLRYLVPGFITSAYFFLKHRALVSGQARVQLTGSISLGKGTVVKPFAIITTWSGRIVIGRNCAISSFNHISTGEADIIIGDNVRIGPHVTLLGGSKDFRDRSTLIVDQAPTQGGLVIGDDVLIGAGAVVLDGCRIGNGAVLGAGCVVTKDVPSYAIMAGVPARVVGERGSTRLEPEVAA